MTSRIAALSLGLISGVATFLFLNSNWTAVLAFLAGAGYANLGAALTEFWPRQAWTICGILTAFAAVALFAALIGGLIETLTARGRIGALRYDPALTDNWNAADWRSAFAKTAVAERAEAMIAATLPATGTTARRVAVDTQLLLSMDRFWLDRLALTRTVSPLSTLVLGIAAAMGLFAYGDGEHWDAVLAAGASGWVAIRAMEYLVRLALSVAVAAAVDMATATLRPLISSRVPEATNWAGAESVPARPAATGSLPPHRAAPAPEGATREQVVEAALPEIRASIERLLSAAPDSPDRSTPP